MRWLACLSESGGVTYLNKECFEELLWWLQVPRLLRPTADTSDQPGDDLARIGTFVAAANAAALAAGYDLSVFQKSIAPRAKSSSGTLVHDVPEHASKKEAETDHERTEAAAVAHKVNDGAEVADEVST